MPGRAKEFERFYGPMARGATEYLSRYSDAELALIAGLLEDMTKFSRAQMQRIDALPAKPKRKPIPIRGRILGQKTKIEL